MIGYMTTNEAPAECRNSLGSPSTVRHRAGALVKAFRFAAVWVFHGFAVGMWVAAIVAAMIAASLPVPAALGSDASRIGSAFDGFLFGGLAFWVLQLPGSAVCTTFITLVYAVPVRTAVGRGFLLAAGTYGVSIGLFLVGLLADVREVMGYFGLTAWGGMFLAVSFLQTLLTPLVLRRNRDRARAWLAGED